MLKECKKVNHPSASLQGCIPTMARAVVVNAAQLASYSQSKQALLDSGTIHSMHETHQVIAVAVGLLIHFVLPFSQSSTILLHSLTQGWASFLTGGSTMSSKICQMGLADRSWLTHKIE